LQTDIFCASLYLMFEKNKEEKVEGRGAYELAFHLVPTLGDDKVGKAFDKVEKLIAKVGGKVVSKSEPALLNLEYAMEKTVDSVKSKYGGAYFCWIIFEGGEVEKLSETLEHDKNVLRHLLIKTEQTDSIKTEEVAKIINGESEEESKDSEEAPEESKESIDDTRDESKDSEKIEEKKNDEEKSEAASDVVDEAIDELVKE
jgi:ribosomal protein S6